MNDPLREIEALMVAGQLDEAEAVLRKSQLKPSYALTVSAAIAIKRGDPQKAEVEFLRALEIDPNNALAAGNLATLYYGQKKLKKALPHAELATKNAPKNETFARMYAACLSDSDRPKDAVAALEPFVQKDKPSLSSLLSYSAVLRGDLRADDSLVILERARALYPESEEAERGIADAYAEIDPKLAQKAFRKVEKSLPGNVQIKWNASFVELRLRNFKRGWQLYEYGLTDKIGRIGRPLPQQVKGLPVITELDALDPKKWTLFCAEQGLGDQVLFFGTLREALLRVPKAAIVGEDRMVSLLQRSFPELQVYTYGFTAGLGKQQHRINGVFPIGSLMRHFRGSLKSFDKHRQAYIQPDPDVVAKYRKTLGGHLPGKRLIGISWRGGFWERQRRTKSFEFELFSRFMKNSDDRFIALQYGDVSEEKALVKKMGWPVTFIDGIDFKKNIDGWVALACACDRIVSVSTALVHFAGAAGKRVDVLIGDYQAPFIWGLEQGRSLPYEGVYVHRKAGGESVEQFFDRVGGDVL